MFPKAFLVLLASTVFVAHGEASPITFNDRVAWQTAVGMPVSTINFEGIAPAGGTSVFADLVLSGVDFGAATVADPGLGNFISAWGTGAMLFGYGIFAPKTVAFSTPVSAFGFNYGATACIVVAPCQSGSVSLTLSSGDTVFGSGGPLPPMQFIGVISSQPLTSITLQITPSIQVLDNFSFASAASQVPEPASFVLLATGLVGVGARLRRRVRTTPSGASFIERT
jgi:PEP-CTERM motif